MKLVNIFLSLVILTSLSCERKDVTVPMVHFSTILPIINARCHRCHNEETASVIGNWADYNQAYVKKDRIYERIWLTRTMPIGYISEDERILIRDWYLTGATE